MAIHLIGSLGLQATTAPASPTAGHSAGGTLLGHP